MNSADGTFKSAIGALNARNLGEAERLFRQVLTAQPNHVAALNLLTIVLMTVERYADAEPLIASAVKLNPKSDVSFYNYGIILKRLNRPQEACEQFDKALKLNPGVAETWNSRGTARSDLGRHLEAIADFDRAVAINASYADALCNKAKSLAELQRFEEALAAYERAAALRPDFGEAWAGGGNVFARLGRYDEAIAAYEKALAVRPGLAEAWTGLAAVYSSVKRYDEALSACERALQLNPELTGAWLWRGHALLGARRFDEAIAAYDRAIKLEAELADAWLWKGATFAEQYRDEDAAACYARVLEIEPRYPFVPGYLIHQRMLACNWTDLDRLAAAIESGIAKGEPCAEPFGYQPIANSLTQFKSCAEIYAREKYPPSPSPLCKAAPSANGKIKVGFLSGEFRQQTVALLMAEFFERHDRAKFDFIAFDNGWSDGSEVRRRMESSIGETVDISRLDDAAAAAAITKRNVDILVNLNGYFGRERTRVFALRPAPVQVNYLGFSATMGASYIDYIIADDYIVPRQSRGGYVEKVVYLPDVYQVSDTKRIVAAPTPPRSALGLPDDAFVFCCFNNSFKITPAMFDVWMRILNGATESVLWLVEHRPGVTRNLHAEAKRRGVDPARIVVSPVAESIADYLARYRAADLFLDTLPFNAGATANDALWIGTPILTCSGETYTARMVGSLLRAVRLPELVTTSLDDYERIAIGLARDPARARAIKERLQRERSALPLFDIPRITRHLERAFEAMHERRQAGLMADHIEIAG